MSESGYEDCLRKSGANGIRTHDLLRAREALSQLSYRPARQYTEGNSEELTGTAR